MIDDRYMGYVKKVNVKVGDHVKREDVLYEMESAEFDIKKTNSLIGDLGDLTSQAENVKAMLDSAQVMVEQANIKARQMASLLK